MLLIVILLLCFPPYPCNKFGYIDHNSVISRCQLFNYHLSSCCIIRFASIRLYTFNLILIMLHWCLNNMIHTQFKTILSKYFIQCSSFLLYNIDIFDCYFCTYILLLLVILTCSKHYQKFVCLKYILCLSKNSIFPFHYVKICSN